MIDLILPWPPSVNKLYTPAWRTAKSGKRYMGRRKSDAAAAYEKEVWVAVKRRTKAALKGNLSVTVFVHPPVKSKRMDIDNVLKACLDSMQNAGLFKNDHQISRLIVERVEPSKDGHLRVLILSKATHPDASAA